MSLVIPNSPSSTPPERPTVVSANVFGAGGRQGKEKRYGDDPDVVFVDELDNPGDRSLEGISAFNKRIDVPVTEEKGIDNEALKKPPLISITAEDRVERKGNPDWVARQFKEVARTDDRMDSVIVPTLAQGYDVPDPRYGD